MICWRAGRTGYPLPPIMGVFRCPELPDKMEPAPCGTSSATSSKAFVSDRTKLKYLVQRRVRRYVAHSTKYRVQHRGTGVSLVALIIIIIIRNSYVAPNPTWLAQSNSQFKTRMEIRSNTWNMHTPDDVWRSNVNSKVQANMHTSRNNQYNPDKQCSNTWTMETSHDCKSNTKSNKNWVLLEGLGEQAGFQLWLKWGVCLCVVDGDRQIIPGYGTLIGDRSLAWVFLFEQRDLQFTCVCGRP